MFSSSSSATDSSGSVYRAYYKQVSSNNQNAYVEKTDSGGVVLWDKSFESGMVDSRGVLALVDDLDRPWVVFTVDGGAAGDSAIHKKEAEDDAFRGVLAGSYGVGGGRKASVVTRLEPTTGKILRGTYFYAVLSDGDTNTLTVQVLGVDTSANLVKLWTKSAAWPVVVGTGMVRDTSLANSDRVDGSFYMYYELTAALDEITAAQLRSSATPDLPGASTSESTALQGDVSTSVLHSTEASSATPDLIRTSTSESIAVQGDASTSVWDSTETSAFPSLPRTSTSESTALQGDASTSVLDNTESSTSPGLPRTSTSESTALRGDASTSVLENTESSASLGLPRTSTSESFALQGNVSTSVLDNTEEVDGSSAVPSCGAVWQWEVLALMQAVYFAA